MLLVQLLFVLFQFLWSTEGVSPQTPLASSRLATIPLLGFGTWNLEKPKASEAISIALQTGYRHLDCAVIYGNQKEVGHGIQEGLKKAGISRSSIWVTSKLWNDRYDIHRWDTNGVFISLPVGVFIRIS